MKKHRKSLESAMTTKKLAWVVGILFAMSLLPVLAVSLYSTPRFDDFGYGAPTHQAFINGGFFAALRAAINVVREYWIVWQGTYSAIFLFSMQPGIFGTAWYGVTGFIMLGSLILSQWFLLDAVFCRWLGLSKHEMVLMLLLLLISEIQFMPSKFEGIYWFNGSSYYTVFFALSLLLMGLFVHMSLNNGRKQIGKGLLCILLGAVLGGGNYTTFLLTAVILATALFFAFRNHAGMRHWLSGTLLVLMAGFVVSALAPGNKIRSAGFTGMPPVTAILASFLEGGRLVLTRTNIGIAGIYCFLLPILWKAAKSSTWQFRLPGLVLAYGFGCFCAQLTPSMYAMADMGGYRQVNIYFYAWHLYLLFALWYVLGWMHRSGAVRRMEQWAQYWQQHLLRCSAVLLLLLAAGSLHWAPHMTVRQTATVSAAAGLARGQVQKTRQEFKDAENRLQSTTDACTIPEITWNQNLSSGLDVNEDPKDWINVALAEYYDCEAVFLEP